MGELQNSTTNFDAIRNNCCDEEGKFSEIVLATYIRDEYGLYSYHGVLYDVDGEVDIADLRKELASVLAFFYKSNLNQRVNQMVSLIITVSNIPEITLNPNEIPLANGTITVIGSSFSFSKEKNHSPYRLKVSYDPLADEPRRFLKWVNDLLHEEDVPGFQEICGYLLLPTTQAQKSFFLLGTGGEGKSIWGWILNVMFGNAFVSCKIPNLSEKFSLATLENKLVGFDDDLNHEALKTTDLFKTVVSNKTVIMAERKYADPFEFHPFVRLCACGNFALSALHDTSDGFFRRLYPIRVKNKPADRKDITDFEEPMKDELPGILNWFLEGLKRLIDNEYHFTISERSKSLLTDIKDDANSIPLFIENMLVFGDKYKVTSTDLVKAYRNYCVVKGEVKRGDKALIQYFKDREDSFNIKHSRHIQGDNRGFIGMGLKSTCINGGGSHE